MLVLRYDKTFGLVLWLFAGASNTDDDYRRYVESIAEMNTMPLRVDVPLALVVVDPENPLPNAHWRREIAEASSRVRPDVKVAFVMPSALARGVVTAVNWLTPLPFEFRTFGTFGEGVAWLEAQRGYPLKLLQELLADARAEAGAPTRSRAG